MNRRTFLRLVVGGAVVLTLPPLLGQWQHSRSFFDALEWNTYRYFDIDYVAHITMKTNGLKWFKMGHEARHGCCDWSLGWSTAPAKITLVTAE